MPVELDGEDPAVDRWVDWVGDFTVVIGSEIWLAFWSTASFALFEQKFI